MSYNNPKIVLYDVKALHVIITRALGSNYEKVETR
jgi:hypothetical protein